MTSNDFTGERIVLKKVLELVNKVDFEYSVGDQDHILDEDFW